MSDAGSDAKGAFLTEVIGAQGAENYHRIIDFMRPRTSAVVDESAWYLSIVGVAPWAQGHGIGAWCLHRTEADVTHFEMLTFWDDTAARSARHIPTNEQLSRDLISRKSKDRLDTQRLNRFIEFFDDLSLFNPTLQNNWDVGRHKMRDPVKRQDG